MTNIDLLHSSFENKDYEMLHTITTQAFQNKVSERGGFVRLGNLFPPDEIGTRTVTSTIKTKDTRVSTVDNMYILGNELLTITDLVWEVKKGKKWVIDKFWILEMDAEFIENVS